MPSILPFVLPALSGKFDAMLKARLKSLDRGEPMQLIVDNSVLRDWDRLIAATLQWLKFREISLVFCEISNDDSRLLFMQLRSINDEFSVISREDIFMF